LRAFLVGAVTFVAALSILAFAATPAVASAKSTPTPKPSVHAVSHKKKKPESKPKPKATPKPAAAVTVTFKVWGNDAGQGTDITYSSNTDSQQTTAEIDGTTWTATLPNDSRAEFYSVDATSQDFQDSTSSVSCSVTVDGKTATGTAGGQSVCDAELSNLGLGWQAS
jgi:hypothetical protein